MAVSVIQYQAPRPQVVQEKEDIDPLDTIIKGLSIASSVYGIKHSIDQSDLSKLQQGKIAQETALSKKTAEDQANPDLPGNILARKLAKEQLGFEAPSTATAQQLGLDVGKMAEVSAKNKAVKEVDPTAKAIREAQLAGLQEKILEREQLRLKEKTPEGKLSKLPASDKQRLDNASLSLKSIQGMAGALESGQNTFSIIGDNEFTQQRSLFNEALGRMQSGGAITDDEAKAFKKMAPTLLDSSEIRQKKLNDLQSEMVKRIKTLGFTPEDVGVEMKDISRSVPRERGLGDLLSGGMSTANANSSRPPIIQNGIQYEWNPKTGKYE